ncbi:MAG: DNA gyrase inhibitor YacG [Verrucomicrobiae bacterium]|nr:DNA gyrase inhibitor YacG [Verrucomicrobiae bacterium]
MAVPRRIKCPTCKKVGDWFGGPYGPFCSERCRLIDLGRWLGEEHRISEPLQEPRLSDGAPAPQSPAGPEKPREG